MLLRCCRTRPDGLLHVFATIGISIEVGVDSVGVGDNIFGVGGAIDTDFDVGIGEYAIFEAAVGVDGLARGLAFVFYDRYFAQSLGTYHSKAPDMVLSSLLIKIDRCAVAGFLTAVRKLYSRLFQNVLRHPYQRSVIIYYSAHVLYFWPKQCFTKTKTGLYNVSLTWSNLQ